MTDRHIDINVPVLARVEGEGALDLRIENNAISDLQLRIYEPPRYFEKFLEGRSYQDVPDTVARICGICPVAYQMSAVHAIESVFGTSVSPWTRNMRRLLYCGEWLQSHSLHIHMLAAPDFLGFNSIIEMSAKYGDEVRRGLKLQGLGNDIMRLLGGRSVHPVGVRAGGFFHAPSEHNVTDLLERLKQSQQDVVDLVLWTATLDLPEDKQEFTSVSLRHADEYAMNEGRLVSDRGLDIGIDEFDEHFIEQHVPHSTALHCLLDDQPYLVGPLARLNNNLDKLPEASRSLLKRTGVTFPSDNMFHSIVARAIEIHFALNEAIRLMQEYVAPDEAFTEVETAAGVGFGCTEAPRGILWHRYELDEEGDIVSARIVPPTSQNQARIEEDIENALNHFGLDNDDAALQLHAEKVIRNYDPCISCATHFLKLRVNRDGIQADDNVLSPVPRLDPGRAISLFAVGSPLPPDNLAWLLAERLQQLAPLLNSQQDIVITRLDRPGTDLLRQIEQEKQKGRQTVILDIVIGETGRLLSLTPAQIAQPGNGLSSHGLGIAESLELAEQLQQGMPDCILGIPVPANQATLSQDEMAFVLTQLKTVLLTS